MPSIFTRIVNGEIPCYKIAETEDYLAFLDIRPMAKGHTLAITKKEVDYIFDVEDDLLAGLMLFAKKVAKALDQTIPCARVGMAVVGVEVPHTHIHLIPLNSIQDISFTKPPLALTAEQMAEIAAQVSAKVVL